MISPSRLLLFLMTSLIMTRTCTSSTEDLVRSFVTASMSCHKHRYNLALSVAVVKDGDTVFADGFGHVDGTNSSSARPTNTTLFGVGSLTKAFTAALLAKTMHAKSIPLYTYLRSSELFDDEHLFSTYEHRKYATVKDVLSHRLGFANHNFLRFSKNRIKDMKHICQNIKKKAAIRTTFYYNNIMYGLMSNLIEKLGNDTFEHLMTSQLLGPIGMSDTQFATTANISALDIAHHCVDTEGDMYRVPDSFTKKWADMAGSGSILSSARDMAKWMKMWLNNGKDVNNRTVLAEAVIEDCLHVENPLPRSALSYMKYYTQPEVPITLSQDVYLLGWRQGYYRGLPVYWHTGSTWGSSSILILIPSKGLGVYIAMTGRDKDYLFRTTTATHILDLYLDLTPWINATQSCTFPAPYFTGWSAHRLFIDRSQNATRALSEYAGTYSNDLYGRINVQLDQSSSALYLTYGWAEFKLYPRIVDGESDEFYMEGQGDIYKVINFAECVFHHNGTAVDRVGMTKWEPSDIPVFKRI